MTRREWLDTLSDQEWTKKTGLPYITRELFKELNNEEFAKRIGCPTPYAFCPLTPGKCEGCKANWLKQEMPTDGQMLLINKIMRTNKDAPEFDNNIYSYEQAEIYIKEFGQKDPECEKREG